MLLPCGDWSGKKTRETSRFIGLLGSLLFVRMPML
uniref:Uncharacterized protein n=1 Tax=Picea sitchensis TaxID=3332 RepID=A9NLT5_PICSI|nr:unknown [Picea sitchensis]